MENKEKEMKNAQIEKLENHILKRYDIVEKKGQGAYGVVFKALDKRTGEIIGLKKNFDAFQNSTDAQRTYREIMILQELNGHDNIVRLYNVIKAENDKDVYLIFEYMETDLHKVIRANILLPEHKQYIMYQLLRALKFIHSAGIIHRDLKPGNLLINADCEVKVCDFGLAKCIMNTNEKENQMTDYVATRWYRAPEILLGSKKYTTQADLWSAGCVFAELLLGKPLLPGKSSVDQITKVLEICRPSKEDLESIDSELAGEILNSITITKTRSFKSIFPKASESELSFLSGLLQFNPNKRLSATKALEHPYLESLHKANKDTEIISKKIINLPIDDSVKYTVKEYRAKLYNDILEKKKMIREELRKIQKNSKNK